MTDITEFSKAQQRQSLDIWLKSCRDKMALRFPKINFDAEDWPVKSLHKSEQADWSFNAAIVDFTGKDQSFCEVVRCLVAEMLLKGKPKLLQKPIKAFRRLSTNSAVSLFDIRKNDIKVIEGQSLVYCRKHPPAANEHLRSLVELSKHLAILSRKNILPQLSYHVDAKIRKELQSLKIDRGTARTAELGLLLDRKIEAFNDAVNAMVDLDPRLDAMDQVTICAMLRKLCAPSRINEVLCSSVDDHVTVEDYARKTLGTSNVSHNAHQLLITMKGSKGAQWSAKPALTFMIDAFHYTEDIIKKHGRRTRMLVNWYQENPTILYLPGELEFLRGQPLSRLDLSNIIYFASTTARTGAEPAVMHAFTALKNRSFKGPNTKTHSVDGRITARKRIDFLPWNDVEQYLLEKVHQAMENCRKVTVLNHYEGDLKKMLFLFDRTDLPYLPYAINDQCIRHRLKRTESQNLNRRPPTLFEKLGITMPVNGRIQAAELDTHDLRRWLTTTALREGEKLSDVLINKWANRSSLAQLKAYDFRTSVELAAFSRMPEIPELTDLSAGLDQARKLEDLYGLSTEIVVVQEAGIRVTSLDRVLEATEDRPIARTSEQIIIIYPTLYGACLHQHHETPCRRYSTCLTCGENYCVKGHIPTNDAIRKDATLLATSIVRQLGTLVPALNRGIADNPDSFADHLEMLVGRGLCHEQMTDQLIAEFHDIKDQIKDKLLCKRLEEAFVARGYVQLLEDDNVPNGALMKYHNPGQHAAPGLEMALDTHGGRAKVACDEEALIATFPVFAPAALGLQDERHLIETEDDDDGE